MDSLLYGHDLEARIVAVQQVGENLMRVYVREGESISHHDVDFYPFFFLSDSSFLRDFPSKHWVAELEGRNFYKYLCVFTRWSEMWNAIRFVIDGYHKGQQKKAESYADVDILHVRTDAVSQFLMQTGKTLFKELSFGDVYRLQLDIESYSSHGPHTGNPSRPNDRIIVIALTDNRGWEQVTDGKSNNEKEMLQELVKTINEKDPDIIEGHNIFNVDLPYILQRCERHNLEFNVGRDGSAPRASDLRSPFTERSTDRLYYDIAGRHVIDTMHLAQAYDVSKRSLDNYGLEHVAQRFGLAKEGRTIIKDDKITWYWDNDPDTLIRHTLDNANETRLLSDHLSPSVFYLSRVVPYNYGILSRLGAAARIESVLLREYVRRKHSVPIPQATEPTPGGYTDVVITGVLGPIIHVDIESLYPSIMITQGISPNTDALGAFRNILTSLTSARLEMKKRMKSMKDPGERITLDATQSMYKILVNSFYGYLGYSRGLFNDFQAAERVARTGQKLLLQLMAAIGEKEGAVVEVDTDGIFFVPPPGITTEKEEQQFVLHIGQTTPKGITLNIDGRYRKILSYKRKNYALLGYDDNITIKGSALMSRSMEPFGLRFTRRCIEALLRNDVSRLHQVYTELHHQIVQRKLTASDLARTEPLRESLDEYLRAVEQGNRNRTANYEVAIASNLHWRPGDRVSYYIAGNDANAKGFENCKPVEDWDPNFPDENIPYYLKRLEEFAAKFEVFFEPQDFRSIFSVEDLFGFSPAGIKILTLRSPESPSSVAEEIAEDLHADPRIWLDEG